MSQGRAENPQITEAPWAKCPAQEGVCLLERLGQALGTEIFESLVTFVLAPQSGSRLSLQRNQNEFTSQLTGPVCRSSGSRVELSDFQDLLRKLAPSKSH